MATGLIFALVCAVVAIVYGWISAQWILSQPTGNDRMREISAAVQEGAQAYLKRQYTTISMVGIVLTVVIAISLGIPTAVGFVLASKLNPLRYPSDCDAGNRRDRDGGQRDPGGEMQGVRDESGVQHVGPPSVPRARDGRS